MSILLDAEEINKAILLCDQYCKDANCYPCETMLQAQHIKSVKAVFEEIELLSDSFPFERLTSLKSYKEFKKKMLEGEK